MKLDNVLPKVIVLLSILLAIYIRLPVFQEFLMPTFGNTFIHITIARETIDSGNFPLIDYSYGGGIPNLYVPAYRMLIAELSLLFGLDLIVVSRYLVIAFAVLSSLSFYLLAKVTTKNEWIGALAALLSPLSSELLVYTLRPLPQSLGMVLVPFALFALVKNDIFLSALSFTFISLLHQETAVVLVGVAFVYYHLRLLLAGKADKLAFAMFALGVVIYLGWHYALVRNLNIFELAQFKYHESGESPNLFNLNNGFEKMPLLQRCGLLTSLFTIPGLIIALKRKNYMLLAFFLLNLVAVENEALGLKVFADRFVAYLCQPMIILAAIAIYQFLSFRPDIDSILERKELLQKAQK